MRFISRDLFLFFFRGNWCVFKFGMVRTVELGLESWKVILLSPCMWSETFLDALTPATFLARHWYLPSEDSALALRTTSVPSPSSSRLKDWRKNCGLGKKNIFFSG